MASRSLTVVLMGDAKSALDAMGKTEKASASMGKKVAAGLAVAGAAFVALGVTAFKIGDQFNDAYKTIRLGTGETGKELEGLREDFRVAFSRAPADAATVSSAIADLNTRLGLTGKPLQDLTVQMVDYARVNNVDVAGATRDVTRLMHAYGVEADDAGLLLDKLTRAAQLSGIGVDHLATLATEAGPAFEEMGFSLDNTLALFAQMERVGARPEEVLSSMNLALNTMAKEGFPNAEEAFAEYMRRIEEAPDILAATNIANELFGARAGSKIAADIREGTFAVDEWIAALEDAEGTLNSAARDTESFTEAWQLFKNNAMLAVEPIATRVFQTISRGMLWMAKVGVPIMHDFIAEIRDRLQPTFDRISRAIQSSVIPAFLAVATFVTGTLIPSLQSVRDFIQRNIVPVLSGALTAAIDGVRTALEHLRAPLEGLRTRVGETFQRMTEDLDTLRSAWGSVLRGDMATAALEAAAWIDHAFGVNSRALLTGFSEVISNVGETVSEVVGNLIGFFRGIRDSNDETAVRMMAVWEQLKDTFVTAFEAIIAVGKVVMTALGAVIFVAIKAIQLAWERWGDFLLEHGRNVFNAILRIIEGVLQVIEGVFNVFAGVFTGDWQRAWDGITQIFSGFGNIIAGIWEALWSSIKTIAKIGWDVITGLHEWANAQIIALMAALRDGAIEKFRDLIEWVKGVPRMILDALGDLGNILKDAGRKVITGLFDGMKEAWESAKGWLGDRAGDIRNLKGPIEDDRRLLIPQGAAIIEGLATGMRSGWTEIEKALGSMTAQIPVVAGDPVGASGPVHRGGFGGGINLTVNVNSPLASPAEIEDAVVAGVVSAVRKGRMNGDIVL